MDKDILAEARDAFSECVDAEAEQRDRMLADLRFSRLDEQWPDEVRRARQLEGRPCLTINKMPAFIQQVVNDARQNKPSIKVHPADDHADRDTAEVMSGLIRNIEYASSADVAYDTGIDHSATMGKGYWRVVMDYTHYDAFDYELAIRRVANPFTVYGDPASEAADSSDWDLAYVTETMRRSEFERKYPEAEATSWEADRRNNDELWFESDAVRIAEYWTREEREKRLLLLSDGTAILEEDFLRPHPEYGFTPMDMAWTMGVQVKRDRMTKVHAVTQHFLTGAEVLDTVEWPGRYIPIIPCYGEEVNVEGRRHYFSLIHRAKDAQRNFNYWRTAAAEAVALAPKSPFIGPKGAFDADIEKWQTANVKNHPFIEYDPSKGAPPQRQPFAGIPAGALQEALNASDDMKAVLGIYDASLGARSNETSGRAIMARQREGDTSTFHFIDNVTRAIRHTGRILIDLIPHVYTGERIVRILGEDGTPQNVAINTQQPDENGRMRRIHDVGLGRYDLTVTAGPGFTTRREEAAFQMTEMIRAFPASAPVIGPHLAKNLDWPGAEEISRDLELISPVTAMKQQAEQKAQGIEPPPDPKLIAAQQDAQLKERELQMKDQHKQAELALTDKHKQQEFALRQHEIDSGNAVKAMLEEMKQQGALDRQHMQGMLRQVEQMRSQPAGPLAAVQIDGKQELEGMSRMMAEGIGAMANAMEAAIETAMETAAQGQFAAANAAESLAQSQQMTAEAAMALAEAAQAIAQSANTPKRVIYNEEGRPIGVEPIPPTEG